MPSKQAPKPSKELSAAALELIASRFRALAEPMRLRLLNTLMQGERTVGQLVEAMNSSQANVSHSSQFSSNVSAGNKGSSF